MGLPRVDADTARALADAGERARALHHDVVDVEHVLVALMDLVKVPIAAGLDFVSLPELRRRLEAALSIRSTRSLYRDGDAAIPMSERLRASIQRAGDIRGLAFYRAVNALELLAALLKDEDIVAITLTARLDATLAGDLLERAATLARDREQDAVLVEHLLLAATETEWFESAATVADLDPQHLARQLASTLDDYGPGKRPGTAVYSAAVVAILRAAASQASGSGSEHVTPQVLTGFAIRARPDVFRGLGGSRAILFRHLVGGGKDRPSDPIDPNAEVDVVFHNDDFTTMDFVIAVLKDHFDLSHPDAVDVMKRVHHSGEGVATRLYADDAQARVDDVLARADEHGMPLRISLRPAARR